MLSAYFKVKTKTEEFKNNLKDILEKLKDKKVLLYGNNDSFCELNKIYNITEKLNITAFVDEKSKAAEKNVLQNINSVPKEDFDAVLLSDENPQEAISNLIKNEINNENIFRLFIEDIKEEEQSINFLYKNKFDKTLPELIKKMKNKKVVLYGAGIFLQAIQKYFDLSELNIIGVADKKYSPNSNIEFLGYKTLNPCEIRDLKPDYVLISTKFYINIFEYLHYDLLKKTKIKIKPLVKKSFFTLLKEI